VTGAVGMYQALPRLSVSSTVCVMAGAVSMIRGSPCQWLSCYPCSGPACGADRRRRRLKLAGRDTSCSSVTRAVGVYQARPLSVVSVTIRRWPAAGPVGPIQVSREITYLGALIWGETSNGSYPSY
jgi:hypothetical protein